MTSVAGYYLQSVNVRAGIVFAAYAYCMCRNMSVCAHVQTNSSVCKCVIVVRSHTKERVREQASQTCECVTVSVNGMSTCEVFSKMFGMYNSTLYVGIEWTHNITYY